ncbi:hypothetical protein IG631_17106 [Alternaria alternata]|nr:hypothetical protein IG631_17106 [Alternaria alternata]
MRKNPVIAPTVFQNVERRICSFDEREWTRFVSCKMPDALNGLVGLECVLFICCPGWIADMLTSVEELLLLLVIVCRSWSIDLKLEKYAAWLIFVCSELGPLPMVIARLSFPVVSGE